MKTRPIYGKPDRSDPERSGCWQEGERYLPSLKISLAVASQDPERSRHFKTQSIALFQSLWITRS